MNMWKFVLVSVLYFSSCSCYPAKPLNERSPDLTWEAWLLVDDHNQNKQISEGVLRRRITPKSVFIAPTFSPESLPACAEGYSSDHLGRCIRIIKLDQAAHYDFLIEKLKEKFNPIDYDDYYDDDIQTPGPYQVNIPLGLQNDETIEESDVAIVVSPTKPQYQESKLDKRDDVVEENLQENLKTTIESTTTEITDTTTQVTTETTVAVTDETTTAETTSNSDWNVENKTTTTSSSNLVRFPDEPETKTLIQSRVKFPSDDEALLSQIPPSVNHNPRSIHESQQSDEPIIDFDLIKFRDSTSRLPEDALSRRNRDKNNGLFVLPPRWTDSNYRRPVVLRFSRKHAYLDMEQFKKPNYYRSIPTDDFAYLFKFKHKR
ncbi:uncharacterized protein LOC130443793 [Diorhabda sublineata]|uniref:uncharacterized protein LOC130443793 n=1 Tax=Diorhabda sublineata TaxID=1163346 RepID=UPI0024E0DFFD|nr:uncharacterized protein LOC130443793 [Diorhabda sublineata]XP_056634610.1 uncharacterized protein LOC130443793 [Diorhabda sublineata]